jgi:lipoic acid synthetase
MARRRFPDWMKRKIPASANISYTAEILKDLNLHTVCDSALCPNRGECFSKKTATFMILGNICTRNCRFCAVTSATPEEVDPLEPEHIVEAVRRLGLKHVVVTSVTRDDLDDGGAFQFAAVIKKLKKFNPELIIEVLTPDFLGKEEAIKKVVEAKPHIFNHNLETVPQLYKKVRPQAIYERSLKFLEYVKLLDNSIYTKSGIMVGLGETYEQVKNVLLDLNSVGCDIVTIGQYLAPSKEHLPVSEYVHPDVFDRYLALGKEIGFKYVAASPFVRSSFNAADFSETVMRKKNDIYFLKG